MTTPDQPFRILAVCSGNICRSPIVERLLTASFDTLAMGSFSVTSAGTSALVGSPIDSRAAGFVQILGGDAGNFAARQVDHHILKEPDLLLALSREHRSRVIEMEPSLLRKTFTLREFARLISTFDGDATLNSSDRWRAMMTRIARRRSTNPAGPSHDDVVDPFRRPDEVYEQMAEELVPAIQTIIDWEKKFTQV